jgi:hypothetical protein
MLFNSGEGHAIQSYNRKGARSAWKGGSDGWVTVGSACLHNRQAPGGDPLATEFINYYAVLGTIDIAAELQNVTHHTTHDARTQH